MLLIPCPWCGARDQDEFSLSSEASKRRPVDPALCDDETWAEYLFGASNVSGPARHLACHTIGCGLWFSLCLDSSTHAVGESLELAIERHPTEGAQ